MIIPIDVKPPKRVQKLWGYELWIHNDEEYCGKLLVFVKKMANFSMHYHLKKKETWYIQQGSFQFNWIDVENGLHDSRILNEGDSVLIERGQPHQLVSLEENSTFLRYLLNTLMRIHIEYTEEHQMIYYNV